MLILLEVKNAVEKRPSTEYRIWGKLGRKTDAFLEAANSIKTCIEIHYFGRSVQSSHQNILAG